jgi:hypothetical protein
MTLARHKSAQMSMETYAKPDPKRLRAASNAVAEHIGEAISGAPCCAYVAQAVGGSRENSTTPTDDESQRKKNLVGRTGFEPVKARANGFTVRPL